VLLSGDRERGDSLWETREKVRKEVDRKDEKK
jgi:hypothetical protein